MNIVMAQNDDATDTKARDEALAWFVRLRSEDATPDEEVAHQAWMSACHENARHYLALCAMWADMDELPDPRRRVIGRPHRRRAFPLGRRSFMTGGAVAALAAGYVAINGLPDILTSDYTTAVAERKSFTLADGSIVDMDADSAIAIDFTATVRNVRLQRGRAFFMVAKDDGRPFSVLAGSGQATALGTEFVVHHSLDAITVTVVESSVSVSCSNAGSAVLQAGQKVSYGDAGLGEVTSADGAGETAWRRGKLIFEDVPLGQVISDVNRYRRGLIRVIDSDLLNLRVSGIFDVNHPDGVLDAITHTLPVTALSLTPYLILLRPA